MPLNHAVATAQHEGLMPKLSGSASDVLLGTGAFGAVPPASAWTTYTPSVSSTTGTITTVGAVSGRFFQVWKLVFWQVSCAITTNGTGAGKVDITLPAGPGNVAAFRFYATGRGNAVSGKQLLGAFQASAQVCRVQNYDNAYPGADGETLELSGVYEVA